MGERPIRVGFIGLNPQKGWAASSHVPALRSMVDFEIVGVANSYAESAQRTAQVLGLKHAYDNATALVNSPDIDLVVVTVRVPHHFELVSAALNAGKHVYCEWPLGNGLDEARELASMARDKATATVIGIQARAARQIRYLRDMVNDGFVGRVLSTTFIGSALNWGGQTEADSAYLYDSSNGATMQSIALGHALAAIREVLGDFSRLDATFLNNFDSVFVAETLKILPKNTPDQIMVHGRMQCGAAISIHYRGGISRSTNLFWEINGSEGDIRITADVGYPQIAPLSIMDARKGEKELKPLLPSGGNEPIQLQSAAVRNVAAIYELAANDIRTGSRNAPSFDDAVQLHELIARIEASAAQKT